MTKQTKTGIVAWIISLTIVILVMVFCSNCNVNPSKLPEDYVAKFAAKVRCATGYKNKCWCFVASRKTGNTDSTGIGLTLAPDELCK